MRTGLPLGRGLWARAGAARERLSRAGLPPLARTVLGVFRHEALWRPLFTAARALRGTGVPRMLAGPGRVGFGMAMLAPPSVDRRCRTARGCARCLRRTWPAARPAGQDTSPPSTVALFRGCVMDTLFTPRERRHPADAGAQRVRGGRGRGPGLLRRAARARRRPGCRARRSPGATSRHSPTRPTTSSSTAPGAARCSRTTATCSATARRARVGAKVRDVSELLAERGPRPGAPLDLDVAYDAPCHLQHAQRVQARRSPCWARSPGCRSAAARLGSLLRQRGDLLGAPPRHGARGARRQDRRRSRPPRPGPQVVATGNPGCLMQIGAGLLRRGPRHRPWRIRSSCWTPSYRRLPS